MSKTKEPKSALRHREKRELRPNWPSLTTMRVAYSDDVSGEFDVKLKPLYDKYEDMDDTTGFVMNVTNPCQHYKMDFEGFKPPRFWSIGDPSAVMYSYSLNESGGLTPYGVIEKLIEADFPGYQQWLSDWSLKLDADAAAAFVSTHSVINFILEGIEACQGGLDALRTITHKGNKALKLFWLKLKENPGSPWLAFNFALKPTLGDLKAMSEVLDKCLKRIAWLRKHNHQDTPVRHRSGKFHFDGELRFECNLPIPIGEFAPLTPPDGDIYFTATVSLECILYKHYIVRFNIPDAYLLDDTVSQRVGYAIMAGISDPLGIVWEAIPFSWLIDWFRSTKAKLKDKSFDLGQLWDGSVVRHCGHTLKMGFVASNVLLHDAGGVKDCGRFAATLYARSPRELESTDSPSFIVPRKWYYVSILAALIARKRRRG